MRLEFEPSVTAFPLVKNDAFDDVYATPDVSILLKKGISAAQAGDRKLARQLLTQVTEAEPGSAEALMWLASISDYPEELLALLDRVLEIDPENEKASQWRTATRSLLAKTFAQRGTEAADSGRYDQAVENFDVAISYDKGCAAAWLGKARISPEEDDRIEFLRRTLAIDPNNEEASSMLSSIEDAKIAERFAAARSHAASGDNESAINALDELLEMRPDYVDAHILRSHLCPDVAAKLASLRNALEIDPENAAARSAYDFLSMPIEAPHRSPAGPLPAAIKEQVEREPLPIEEPAETFEPPAPDVSVTTVEFAAPEFKPTDVEVDLTQEIDPFKTIIGEPQVSDLYAGNGASSFAAEGHDSLSFAPQDEYALTRELLAPVDVLIDAESDTLESLPVYDPKVSSDPGQVLEEWPQEPEYSDFAESFASTDPLGEEPVLSSAAEQVACAFCFESNDPEVFECSKCHASLDLSDIEALIENPSVDHEIVRSGVERMEAQLDSPSAVELINLGIGHFHLRNYNKGIKYLQEASLLTPHDAVLSGHINTLVIRVDEYRRKNEADQTLPGARTILVVDDSSTVRKLISGKLERAGHTVVCAENGAQALERFAERMPDLVLLDITMPDMDGYEVCRQMRENAAAAEIPVVMISDKDGFFDKVRGKMAGTTAYITKPFGPETLMKALERHLGNGVEIAQDQAGPQIN